MANSDQLDGEWDLTGEKAKGAIKMRFKWDHTPLYSYFVCTHLVSSVIGRLCSTVHLVPICPTPIETRQDSAAVWLVEVYFLFGGSQVTPFIAVLWLVDGYVPFVQSQVGYYSVVAWLVDVYINNLPRPQVICDSHDSDVVWLVDCWLWIDNFLHSSNCPDGAAGCNNRIVPTKCICFQYIIFSLGCAVRGACLRAVDLLFCLTI